MKKTKFAVAPVLFREHWWLYDLDVPERKQPFGTTAKQAQSDLAFRNHAQVVEVDKERYRRIVGRVYVDGFGRQRGSKKACWAYCKAWAAFLTENGEPMTAEEMDAEIPASESSY